MVAATEYNPEKDSDTTIGCLILTVGVLACIGGAFSWTWASWLLYGWFLQPTFLSALPVLTYWQVFGVRIAVRAFTGMKGDLPTRKKKSDAEKGSDALAGVLWNTLGPLFVVGVGWLILQAQGN